MFFKKLIILIDEYFQILEYGFKLIILYYITLHIKHYSLKTKIATFMNFNYTKSQLRGAK